MKNFKIILLLIANFFFLGCKNNSENIAKELKTYNNKLVSEANVFNKKTAYETIRDVERIFISNGIINSFSKQEYRKISRGVSNEVEKKIFSDILSYIDTNTFSIEFYGEDILFLGPDYIIRKTNCQKNSTLYMQYEFCKMIKQNEFKYEKINDFLEITNDDDFSNIVYRTPIIVYIYMYILNKYEER